MSFDAGITELLFDKFMVLCVVGLFAYTQKKFLDRLEKIGDQVVTLQSDFAGHEKYVHGKEV